jgi:hypothetical protein
MSRLATGATLGAQLLLQRMQTGAALSADLPASKSPSARVSMAVGVAVSDGLSTDVTEASATETPTLAALPPLPAYVAHALARYALLHDIPFRYLVPDAALLPPESIRFFTIDAAWIAALTEGALNAGGRGSRELARVSEAATLAGAQVQAVTGQVRAVARRQVIVGGESALAEGSALSGNAPTGGNVATRAVTGLLLRSEMVVRWPGMKVRAWASASAADIPTGADPAVIEAARPELVVPLLRLECLGPDVLLALFDGQPRMLWLEEPHHAVQFGVERDHGVLSVALRDAQGELTGQSVPVPLRPGPAAGVVDIGALARGIDAALPLPFTRGSAALAAQLLQAPSRQRFGD